MARYAEVVCPPELSLKNLLPSLMAEVECYLASLPRRLRVILLTLFVVFDQSARFSRQSTPRRFVALNESYADAFVNDCLSGSPGFKRTMAATLKGIVTFNYYELPEVKKQLGYAPTGYVEEVSRRRLERYGDEINREETAVYVDSEDA